jgi:ribose transport system substrate-binding protein
MERSAELLAQMPPLKGRIASLRIVNTENSASAENAALNSAILTKPDLILFDAASAAASNQAIQAACAAGITVVSFDVLVTAPCAWKIGVPFYDEGHGFAEWMAKTIGGKGTIFMDLGTAGAKSSGDWNNGANAVFAKYPGIKVYTFYGNFSPGGEQSAVATLLTAHPNVDGILTQDYGAYSLYALAQAHHAMVPVTGYSYNESLLACLKYKVACLFHSSPTWVSGEAMRLGIDVLDGKVKGTPHFTALPAPWFRSNTVAFSQSIGPVYTVKDSAQPSLAGGIMLPLSPAWATLKAADVMTKP